MTLAELRAMVRELVGDRATLAAEQPLTDATYNSFINAAMQQIVALARSLQDGLFVVRLTTPSFDTAGAEFYQPTLSPTNFTRVHRLLYVLRAGVSVPIVAPADAAADIVITAGTERVGAVNEGLGVYDAATGSHSLLLCFVAGLNDMTVDANTPGQWSSTPYGVANFLPATYHPLIALKAAVWSAIAMGTDPSAIQGQYNEAVATLQADLLDTKKTPERD